MKVQYVVDGKMVSVDVVTCYKVLKGTTVHLIIGVFDKVIVTQKTVVYTDDDLEKVIFSEYYFKLPPNDMLATTLIVKKVAVDKFTHHQL